MSRFAQILIKDFNNDEHRDIILTGNLYGSEVETPSNDGCSVMFMAEIGDGSFTPLSITKSGFIH